MQDLNIFIHQHWQLSSLFALLLVLTFIVEFIRLRWGAARLNPTQITNLINHQNALVLDLRPAASFASGHIIGSMSIPAEEFKDKAKKIEKMKTRPIILVCAKGLESPKIATTLKNQGFHVHILGGGINSWTNADLPLVKE